MQYFVTKKWDGFRNNKKNKSKFIENSILFVKSFTVEN